MASTSSMVLVTGNTYPVKDAIKALGGRWDADAKGWRVPADKAAEAQALVAGAGPKPAYSPRPGTTYSPRASSPAPSRRSWSPCGYPGCTPSYCDECDGEGYRAGR